MSSANPSRQILGIDLLRALAAILVMLFHLSQQSWMPPARDIHLPGPLTFLAPVVACGWIGVEIFFVLSGFVIAYSTLGSTPARFVQHRITRLLPAAMLCATLTLIFDLRGHVGTLGSLASPWLRSISLSPLGPWIDLPYWTLAIELAFYLFIFLLLSSRLLAAHFESRLALVLGLLGGISTAFCAFGLARGGRLISTSGYGFPPRACLLLVHGCFFALGVFLYLLLLHRVTPLRLLMTLVCTAGAVMEISQHRRDVTLLTHTGNHPVLPIVLWLLTVLALVASVLANPALHRLFGRHGALRIRQLGMATYPLYLLHCQIGYILIGHFHRRLGFNLAMGLAIVTDLALALAVSQLLEPPLQGLFRRLWALTHRVRPPIPAQV